MGSQHFNHEQKLPTHFPCPAKSLRPIYGSEMQTWLPDWPSTHLIHSTFKLSITVDVVVTICTSSHYSSGVTYRCLIHDYFKKHIILRIKLSFLSSQHSNQKMRSWLLLGSRILKWSYLKIHQYFVNCLLKRYLFQWNYTLSILTYYCRFVTSYRLCGHHWTGTAIRYPALRLLCTKHGTDSLLL